MTHDKTQQRLDALAEAMSEKGIRLPDVALMQKSGGRRSVHLGCHHADRPFDGEKYKILFGHDIDAVLFEALEYIARLPDPDTAAKQQWQRKLGDVIDEGHDLGMPDEVMTPLRTGSQAMTENLLAAPEASQ